MRSSVFMRLGSLLLLAGLAARAAEPAPAPSPAPEQDIRVDVPVKLEKVDVVFNLDHLAFSGDMPVGLRYPRLLADRLKEAGTKGRLVAVFHGDAAYMTLGDQAYDAYRHVSTGNPYKQLLADLLARGVQLEECAVSMKSHGWTNADLLPGVKVNGGAVMRIVQLVQQGYVQIEP